jgi:hypothetical protein
MHWSAYVAAECGVCRARSGIADSDGVPNQAELRRRFDSVVGGWKIRPYPTPRAIANTYVIATIEFPEAAGLNSLGFALDQET